MHLYQNTYFGSIIILISILNYRIFKCDHWLCFINADMLNLYKSQMYSPKIHSQTDHEGTKFLGCTNQMFVLHVPAGTFYVSNQICNHPKNI